MKEITDELLTRLAGKAAFAKGELYFRESRVADLNQKRSTITAMVSGTEDWAVTLKHTAAVFEGSCDCPASENIDFCKHCVAVAMAYRQQLVGQKAVSGAKAKDRLPVYLESWDKKDLLKLVLELLPSDKAKLQELRIKAEVAAGKMDDKAIRKQITTAIPHNRHIHKISQARQYFHQVEATLQTLGPHIDKLAADVALGLIIFAIERLDKALETVDDSGGYRDGTVALLEGLHLHTLGRWDSTPEAKADYLFSLFGSPATNFLPNIPSGYAEVLGQPGLAHYNHLVRAKWDALPPLTSTDWEVEYAYRRLLEPLLSSAKAANDRDEVIALLTKIANDSRDYLNLSVLCLENQQLEQAQWWHKRAEKDKSRPLPLEEVENNQIAIWKYMGEHGKIAALLWQRFQRRTCLQSYLAVVESLDSEAEAEIRKKAFAYMRKQQSDAKDAWSKQRAVDGEVQILIHYREFGQALDIAENKKLDTGLLCRVLEVNHDQPKRVLPLYFHLASHYINRGENSNYMRAIDILNAALDAAADDYRQTFIAKLQALLVQYKQKRNFVLYAKKSFGDLL